MKYIYHIFLLFLIGSLGDLFADTSHCSIVENCESDLIVEVDRDCTNAQATGYYTLTVSILEGEAPFTISGSINQTLENLGSISIEIEDGELYDITVVDA
ncbi:MAG: hypothetical protein AB8B69_11305, partial [Chitinophagales bacterium]